MPSAETAETNEIRFRIITKKRFISSDASIAAGDNEQRKNLKFVKANKPNW